MNFFKIESLTQQLFTIFTMKRCFAGNSFWNLLTRTMEPFQTPNTLNHKPIVLMLIVKKLIKTLL